jgi:putative spermidine/putrescine transport system ATP-binding protein
VARFVGQINLLPVEVVNVATGLVRVGPQVIRAGQTLAHVNGNPVRLAVRPEELCAGKREGMNNLVGRVSGVTYLGSIVRLRLEIEGQPVFVDMFNERQLRAPSPGDDFPISFAPEACWLL